MKRHRNPLILINFRHPCIAPRCAESAPLVRWGRSGAARRFRRAGRVEKAEFSLCGRAIYNTTL